MSRNMKGGKRIINVSNRLPVKIARQDDLLTYQRSEGGLATGLSALFQQYDHLWIGWPGAVVPGGEQEQVISDLEQQQLVPVFLTQQEVNDYYEGFCNETLWPLFHYFPSYSGFNADFFAAYQEVNQRFADEIIRHAEKDDVIWIHDYQLMMVPELVRKALPEVTIGFFNHIPFPSYPVFMALPWREQILRGLLGADLVGFQTQDDTRHFMECVERMLGTAFTANELTVNNRKVVAGAFPISIDYQKYHELAAAPATQKSVEKLQDLTGGKKLIISVDRLDYSKGILQRLKAYELFLQQHPEWHEQVTFVHLVVPSRDTVRNYKELKEEMNKLITDINGKYATLEWQPVCHFYRSFPEHLLSALYKLADVALVTPLRDGMNLVSKEYVASNTSMQGVLVLSESAGAAGELKDALQVNPNDVNAFSEKIFEALVMPEEQRRVRMERMQAIVAGADVFTWASQFMGRLEQVRRPAEEHTARYISNAQLQKLEMNYSFARRRLILLDYDGTLVNFRNKPEDAAPDPELLSLLQSLTADRNNTLVIVSGRDRQTLQEWFGHLPIGLVAEHGAQYREKGTDWQPYGLLSNSWKPQLYQLLNAFTRSAPGAFIEEKSYSLVWHYRQCEPQTGQLQAAALKAALEKELKSTDLQLLEGNKVIEIKNQAVNKGKAARRQLGRERYDFILAIGDDTTDEYMFRALPDNAVSVKVGSNQSAAHYFVNSTIEVRHLLESMHQTALVFRENTLQIAR